METQVIKLIAFPVFGVVIILDFLCMSEKLKPLLPGHVALVVNTFLKKCIQIVISALFLSY